MPKKPKRRKAVRFVGFRLTAEDHQLFTAAAKIAHKSITRWVNDGLRQIANQQVVTVSATSREDND